MTNEFDYNFSDEIPMDDFSSGQGVRLPFPVVYLTPFDGVATYPKDNPVQRYGGFRTNNLTDFQELIDAGIIKNIPAGFKKIVHVTNNGNEIECYATRSLDFAPVGYRSRWLEKGGFQYILDYDKNKPNFSVRHIQILGYAQNGETVFPVVISRRGYAAGWLQDCVIQHVQIVRTLNIKTKHGVLLTASCFKMRLGTFGEKPALRKAGKGDLSKMITYVGFDPAIVKQSDDYKKAELVGDGMKWAIANTIGQSAISETIALKKSAREWLDAWKTGVNAQPETPPTRNVPQSLPAVEEEFPF